MTIEELQVVISAEIGDLKKELQNGHKEIQKFAKNGDSGFKKFSEAAKAAGKVVGTAMKATATALAAGATALVALSESTEEYRVNQAKLQTAFETAGASAEQAKETYNDLYRVLGDDDVAVEAANHLAQLTTSEQELAEWTQICQGVYASFGDSLPIEGLTEAANETAKTGQVTGVLADALNWGSLAGETFGVTLKEATKENEEWNKAVMAATTAEDYFNLALQQCNSEAEREALIRQTLNSAYQEAAANYEEQAAAILRANEAQAALNEALGALGEAVTPLVTIFKEFGAQILADLVPGLTQVIAGIQGIIEGTNGAAEQFETGLGAVLDSLLNNFTAALPQILEIGIQLITSLIEGIVQYLPEVVSTVVSVIPQITEAIAGLLPQLLECGVDIIYELIHGIIDTLPELTDTVSDLIPEIIDTLMDGVTDLYQAGIDLFIAIVEAIPEIIPSLMEALPDIIDTVVQFITTAIPILLETAIEFLMAIVDAIPEIIPPLIEALPEIVDAILEMVIDNIPVLLEAAIELFMAIVDAIPQMIPSLVEAIPQIITSIIDAIIKAIPQVLAAALQLFIALPTALLQIIPELINAFGQIKEKVKTQLVDKLKALMNFKWELPKLKLPKITVTGKFSLSPLQVPKFSISWNKLGGVFDDPTLFWGHGGLQGIGEDGAEAVVPLEKNTQWMNILAEKLTERMAGGNRPVILQVDGKTFAETSISTINELTRQTGSLSLVLV